MSEQCPDLKVSDDGIYSPPYFDCKSEKWMYDFRLNDVDRRAVMQYCCTQEHRRCIMSSDFDETTPGPRRLTVIPPGKPTLGDFSGA